MGCDGMRGKVVCGGIRNRGILSHAGSVDGIALV